MIRIILLCFVIFFASSNLLFAQGKKEQSSVKPSTKFLTKPLVKPWLKSCVREGDIRTICVTAQNFFLSDGQKLASVGVQVDTSDDKILLLASVPVGVRIKPGVMIFINERSIRLEYELCVNNVCEAFIETDKDFIDFMSKAKVMDLTYITYNGQRIRATMKMDYFTEVFNGEPQRVQNSIVVIKRK